MKDKKISVRVYEKYDLERKRFIAGNKLNFYLSDIGSVMEAEREKDCCVNLMGQTQDRKSTRLNSSHSAKSRMPSSA